MGGSDIWQMFLELLANGHEDMSTRALARREPVNLTCPHLSICGNTTPENLKGGVDKSDIKTGAVNRLLFWDCSQDWVTKPRDSAVVIIEDVRKRLEQIFSKTSNLTSEQRSYGIRHPVDEAVNKYMYELEKECEGKVTNNMIARHNQMSFTVALIRAIYEDIPVSLGIYKWGYELAKHSYMFTEHLFKVVLLVHKINHTVVLEEKIIEKLKPHKAGLGRTALTNAVRRWIKRAGGIKVFNEIIEALHNNGAGELLIARKGSKTIYKLN